jgi:hypothetical protein
MQANQYVKVYRRQTNFGRWAYLGIGMCVGFGCEVVSMYHQLRLCLSMPLSLRLILLGLGYHLSWRLLFCSTCRAVRHLTQAYDKAALRGR